VNYATVSPTAYYLIPNPVSKANLVLMLTNALVSVGWTATAITGGYRLQTISPQAYTVKCDIWDPVNQNFINIMLHGSVNGYTHFLIWDSSLTYQIVCHPCGFAISRPGVQQDANGSTVFAGIPQTPFNCGEGGKQVVTEVFFSFGDMMLNPFVTATNPRRNLDKGNNAFNRTQTGVINGVLYPGNGPAFSNLDDWAAPMILRKSSQHPLWYGEFDFMYPALVAWGDGFGADKDIKVRGQIYNAICRSGQYAMDTIKKWDGFQWINYTDQYFYGSLWLIKSIKSLETENIAY